MKLRPLLAGLIAGTIALVSPTTSRAELFSYYVGIDDRLTIPTGTYAGLANPNLNRLTFLYAPTYEGVPSTWHYHSKATFIYTGPNLGLSTAVGNSASNFVPEGTAPPIKLQLGTGIYDGKLITATYADPNQVTAFSSALTIGSTQSLAGFGPTAGETFLFNSSGGRWDSAFTDADLHFELVSLTPGLNFGGLSALDIGMNAAGDDYHLAAGLANNSFSFTPVLWTEANAAPGIYEATFKLVDESNTFGDSGIVRIRTEVVPEPSTVVTLLGGVGLLLARRRRMTLA